MYSKLIDLYTFDITETRHIHWMGYVITQTMFEDLVKLLGKNEKGIQANGNILVKRSKNGVTIERKDTRTSITLKNVVLENLLKR